MSCTHCGAKLQAISPFCPQCGASLPADGVANDDVPSIQEFSSAGGSSHGVKAPSLAPTIIVTLLFGLFGLIPATQASRRATAIGAPATRYWKAFWASLAALLVCALACALFALGGLVGRPSTAGNVQNGVAAEMPTNLGAWHETDPQFEQPGTSPNGMLGGTIRHAAQYSSGGRQLVAYWIDLASITSDQFREKFGESPSIAWSEGYCGTYSNDNNIWCSEMTPGGYIFVTDVTSGAQITLSEIQEATQALYDSVQ